MIRFATPEDAASVAPLIILAMGDLAIKFSNDTDAVKTQAFFEHFFRLPDNQYSYQNTLVFEENGLILGSLNAYDGAKLLALRKNFLDYLKFHNGLLDFNPEPETEAGEFYLDSLGVNPEAQGKGIGKKLINAGIAWAKELKHKTVGLIVEFDNDRALKFYLDRGFTINNQKEFVGGKYHHMIYQVHL
ncbi:MULTISPECIES: GNAT family N-acetyltransferase [unclassified Pedobacter]|uniref:GNAT family N-acetyltransferase n=1 Tax=unclassified Pedobacter TaxID=2628915 RepID=UPI001E451A4B|nr:MULTISPECIES: GNAT family N-acetyltransferase [unclassified Pedobacter]